MNTRKIGNRLSTLAAAAALSLITAQSALSADWKLADTPLFLSASVKPNLIMAIDDSGSMDFELLLRGNDGAAWWRTAASGSCDATSNNSFAGCIADGTTDVLAAGQLNFNNSGNSGTGWKKYAYLFPNGQPIANSDRNNQRRLLDSTNDHFAIAPLPVFGWSRSAEYNRAYFDPAVTYNPWPNGGGFTFTNATPTSTRWDPVYPILGVVGQPNINLTQDFIGAVNTATTTACNDVALGTTAVPANYYFKVYNPTVLPVGTCFRPSGTTHWYTVQTGATCTVGVAGCPVSWAANNASGTLITTNTTLTVGTNIAIRYFPATFYTSSSTPPAGMGFTGTPINDGRDPAGNTMWRYEIKPANFAVPADYDRAIQNFANWFQFYRKRHQALRAGLGTAFLNITGTRVAGFRINQTGGPLAPDVTMLDIDDGTNKTNLYTDIYRNWTASGGTPNRPAVANIIRNFERDGDGAPITHSCQRNFGMLFTDGFSNIPAAGDGVSGAGNVDGDDGAPFADSVSGTLADRVMEAYETNLRPDLDPGKVLVPTACSSADHPDSLDCRTDPHMNFYAVTLGTRGLQFNPDSATPQDPFTTAPTWPTAFPARHPNAVDDIWHATINSRGQLLNAKSSAELAEKLSTVLLSIIERVGSASSAAVNSGSVNSESRLFQASFDSKDWSGRLIGRRVNGDGSLGEEVVGTIPEPGDRDIFTVNASGLAVPFLWDSLDNTRQGELKLTETDTLAQNRLNWIRGDRTDEAPAANNLRKRASLMGDIVNSSPAYVGIPNFAYSDSLEAEKYSEFRNTHIERTHMVYVGANDGMLHAFSSDDSSGTGPIVEKFAFIPSVLVKNLALLTSPSYTHRYYVDGSPVINDAFVGGEWRTMLVGGLDRGGQEIYALDITDPDTFDEDNVKWEFTDADDEDLGYTYARPNIVRTNSGKWMAGFGNGYNSTATSATDTIASSTGNAVLFMVDLETGEKAAKLDTEYGTEEDTAADKRPNGLSTPVFIDINGDRTVDYAYAGDLFGNLWKFDLTSTNPDEWHVSYSGKPLFVATNDDNQRQPITSRPNVARNTGGAGFVVLFGTGKYIEVTDSDVDTLDTQSFYGVFDANSGEDSDVVGDRDTALGEQTIDQELYGVAFGEKQFNVRALSNNAPGSKGWYIDLVSPVYDEQGEMQVTDSLVRSGRVIFTTLVPNDDPCESGGSSWIMEMNLFTGARTAKTPWDLNDNGLFDDGTYSGLQSDNGLNETPTDIYGESTLDPPDGEPIRRACSHLIFPGTDGSTVTRCRDPGPRGFGRQSWRQAH